MPTLLTRERHLAGLRAAAAVVERCAGSGSPPRAALAEVLRAHAAAPAAERDHWARRACHEATLLALEVSAGTRGRDWLDPDVAADGIDELLGRCRLRPAEPGVLVVAPRDRDEWWSLELGAHRPRLTRHAGGTPLDGDWELRGPAVALFVRLATRGPMSQALGPGLPDREPTTPSREAHP